MTPEEFKVAQERMGLTNKDMATRLYCSLSHVENMRSGRKPVSDRFAQMMTLLLRAHKVLKEDHDV